MIKWIFMYIYHIVLVFLYKLTCINYLFMKTSFIIHILPYEYLINLSFFLILLGLWGACINKANLFKTILSLELIYLGINLFFITIGLITLDIKSFIITLLIFSSAASETIIILSLLISLFTFNKTIHLRSLNNLN